MNNSQGFSDYDKEPYLFDMKLLLEAAFFAACKHRTQRRKNTAGAPYINHCLEVARHLAVEGGVDDETILCAAILHDTVEDTDTSKEELTDRFGQEIAGIVMECTDDKALPKAERKRLQIGTAPTNSPAISAKLWFFSHGRGISDPATESFPT